MLVKFFVLIAVFIMIICAVIEGRWAKGSEYATFAVSCESIIISTSKALKVLKHTE